MLAEMLNVIRRVGTGLAVALAAGLAISAHAVAVRPATPDERLALSHSGDLAGMGFEGVEMTVSTVNPSWASLATSSPSLSELRDNVAVVRRAGASWELVAVIDPEAPLEFCGDLRTPVEAGVDLEVCKRPPALPVVWSIGSASTRPRELGQGAHGYYKRLRWSRWTAQGASGRGVFDYADRYDRIIAPVQITLRRPQRCRSGVVIFTRQRIVAVRRADRARIRFATSVRGLPGCPALYQEWD